jgi:hypothetical protein
MCADNIRIAADKGYRLRGKCCGKTFAYWSSSDMPQKRFSGNS